MSDANRYRRVLALLEEGQYDLAGTRIRQLRGRRDRNEIELQRRLLSTRVALKTGVQNFSHSLALSDTNSADPLLIADSEFVKGLTCFQNNAFTQGIAHFEAGERLYRSSSQHERELLSAYNVLIGQINESSPSIAPEEVIFRLRALEKRSRELKLNRITGLIVRQKSYAFLEMGRSFAALDEAIKACVLLELHGPSSDFQLSLLHAADCALDTGDRDIAQTHFEKVIPPIDARVQFPLAYIEARLRGTQLQIESFQIVSPHWKQRYERNFSCLDGARDLSQRMNNGTSIHWDRSRGELNIKNGLKSTAIRIVEGSLEAKLLAQLSDGRQGKALLCERLWPEGCETSHLDNRLHRLISRMNRKLDKRIGFDGQSYFLREKVSITN